MQVVRAAMIITNTGTHQRVAESNRFAAHQPLLPSRLLSVTALAAACNSTTASAATQRVPSTQSRCFTAAVMPASEVISSYHDLWHVEQSFRMSKSDLAARPIYHHLKDSIEAHLTVVFTALAVAHDLQARSGWSIKRIVRGLRPLQQVTITLAGQQLHAEPAIPDDIAELLTALDRGH